MRFEIQRAEMSLNEDENYVGRTIFTLENHKAPYEITFFSKKGKEWEYSLSFAGEPGSEEQFLEADELLENDDELFDDLLDAALDQQKNEEQ